MPESLQLQCPDWSEKEENLMRVRKVLRHPSYDKQAYPRAETPLAYHFIHEHDNYPAEN